MKSAITIGSQIVSPQPLTDDVTAVAACHETTFTGAYFVVSGEICWLNYKLIESCESAPICNRPDACKAVETKAKIATAWPDCISEWNIRDP